MVPMADRRIQLLGLLGLLFAASAPAPAPARTVQPADLAEAWRWRRFDREEGLPAGSITAIGYEREGDYIYVASPRGILRYMGFQWEPIASGAPFAATM